MNKQDKLDKSHEDNGVADSDSVDTPSSSGWFKPIRLRRNHYLFVIGLFTLIGVVGGYTYYSLVGCKTGGCAITSSPTMSIIWGGMMGYLLPDVFVKQKS